MKCGFVQWMQGQWMLIDALKDNDGIVQNGVLRRGANGTVKIPGSQTFRFEGYKSSIIRFLLDYSLRTFETTSPHLYIRGGKEMETDVAKVLLETVPKALTGAIKSPDELWEAGSAVKDGLETAYDYVKSGMNKAAKQGEKVRPGGLYTWLDHRANKRLILDLQSHAPVSESAWKQLDPKITFANLAGFIRDEF